MWACENCGWHFGVDGVLWGLLVFHYLVILIPISMRVGVRYVLVDMGVCGGMPWVRSGRSPRSKRFPADWEKRRRVVLERDGFKCQWRLSGGGVCGAPATDVDHEVPNDDNSFANLRALCSEHHRRKTGGEGGRGYWAAVKRSRGKFVRVEKHPGLCG